MAGDELLRNLARLLSQHVRRNDTAARLDGDEFGLLMERCPLDKAHEMAEKLRKTVEEFQYVHDDKPFSVSVSIGIGMVPILATSGTLAPTMSAADNACYRAKEHRVHVYHEDDAELAQRYHELQWLPRIIKALEEDLFELWCQPIVAVRPGRHAQAGPAHHYELLIRMLCDDGQTIPPSVFLPPAERYGLAPKIDH